MKTSTTCSVLILFMLFSSIAFADFKVYSANDEFIGYMTPTITAGISIYNQKINSFFGLARMNTEIPSYTFSDVTSYHTKTGCTGITYLPMEEKFLAKFNDKIYQGVKPCGLVTINSMLADAGCMDFPISHDLFMCTHQEVTSIPFSLPIQGPLRYEFETSGQSKVTVVPLIMD